MRYALLFMFASGLLGCSSDTATEVSRVDPPASTETINAAFGEATASDADVIVIDVRSKDEWDSGHVERAVHIPHTEIAARISEVTEDKDAMIVVYCAVGGRAGKAKATLEEHGFTNVENGGGYDDVKYRFK